MINYLIHVHSCPCQQNDPEINFEINNLGKTHQNEKKVESRNTYPGPGWQTLPWRSAVGLV